MKWIWLGVLSLSCVNAVIGQGVTCTAEIPEYTCRLVTIPFKSWESRLIKKVPVVIADPASFKQERKSFAFTFNHLGMMRNVLPFEAYSENILFERGKGSPCPVRVVISTDEFQLQNEKAQPSAESALRMMSTMDTVGAFLAGCESSLDY